MRIHRALALFLPSLCFAQESVSTDAPQATKMARGEFGIDFTSQYFFRGLQQENQGIIAQPWFELGYRLADAKESLRNLDLKFGQWNSLHSGPTGSTDGIWYESDFFVDLNAGIGERWTVATRYTAYTSPNGEFDPVRRRGFRETVEEISFTAGFDDRALWIEDLNSGLRPHVTIAFELDGQRDNGNDRGVYAEVGVAPRFDLGQMGALEVSLTVPVTIGLSIADYYEDESGGRDENFGYLDVGAVLTSPLKFLPYGAGPWTGELGLHWLLLGDNLEERNDGDTSELIVNFGLATRF